MDLQKHFHKYNLFVGWGVFLIALLTYGLSVEPTVSFWDCGEYIATSAKLEVGHPPGAPFFQMVGAFFASFSPSPEMTALFVNFISVFSSAFTILFLYFIIVNFTQKIVLAKGDTLTNGQVIAIYGSGVVGALAYTFSDSFWFNATEAEVYAMAMLFMSAMFWLGLKWTDNLDSPRGDKWLLLIALVVGLSFGVHFMALLTIPAIGMLYFFQSHFKKNVKNFILANVISISILLLIFKLILPYTLALFGHTEVFFVNTLHLPFNSGTIFTGVWIIAAFAFTLRKAQKHQKRLLQTATLCLLFVFVGFSSWLMIPIRSNAGTVINENSPTDARLLLAYYNLEQYQKTYLFKGPMYSDQFAPPVDYTDEKPKYERDYKAHRYIIVNNYKDALEAPNPNHIGLLPRMWSGEHAANYMSLTTPLKYRVNPKYMGSQEVEYMNQELQAALYAGDLEKYTNKLRDYQLFFIVEKPSFWDNLSFMFRYQFDYMYLRYLLWNFVGRQDDIQGKISNNHGNWISGISFIDEWHTGYPQDHLPSDAQNNRGRNTYFFLPLLLGLVGLFFQFSSSKRQWWVVSVLFLFTGLALKVYLNERPFEPRERDYALVGSFFTFAIWIGMGVYALYSLLQEKLSSKWIAPGVVLLCVLVVPARMLTENWDDHDRSNRYTARALGKSYLDSVSKDNGATWTDEQLDDSKTLIPSDNIAYTYRPITTNDSIDRVLLAGSATGQDKLVAWTKLADYSKKAFNYAWAYVDIADNHYALPILTGLSMATYDNGIIALGMKDGKMIEPMISRDGGISWRKAKAHTVPADDANFTTFTSTVDSSNFIWIIGNGKVWRGRLNRLGWTSPQKSFER